ncbi:MAG TPA: TIGR01777 family oxidoreductase [Pyrinomonadaceae bacterium]|nr:TIGR01777 family oxidoreductase [Pyrinomonadaceae bacterium]
MKVVIPGGSGQVGTVLARAFHKRGDEVVVLSRTQTDALPWRVVEWDGESLGPWTRELEGAAAVINLAGQSVNCRYTQANRRRITESRVKSTRIVGQAIAETDNAPGVWLQASTATLYAHRHDAPNDEATGIIGGSEPNAPDTWRFSIDVVKKWEREFNAAATPNTRKVLMRSAIVMSPGMGGPFDMLLRLVRFGLGGRFGDGKEFVSWIHDQDFVRSVDWLIQHHELAGPVNLASPNPLPNVEFMQALRKAWGIPFGLPATEWMLEIGAFVLRSETELMLKSRRVVPTRLLLSGFSFGFPTWPEAAHDLCTRWRQNT